MGGGPYWGGYFSDGLRQNRVGLGEVREAGGVPVRLGSEEVFQGKRNSAA